jgi:hypothetical protein
VSLGSEQFGRLLEPSPCRKRDTLNGLGEGRIAIAQSESGVAAGLLEHASLHIQIAIVVRLFDVPGRRKGRTDRLSFPVAAELLDLPGVMEALIEDARGWPVGEAQANENQVRRQVEEFKDGLQRLLHEQPNRLEVLRRFRDVNIAHELTPIAGEPRPQYGHLTALTEEILALAKLLQNVVSGSVVFWQRGHVTGSALALWRSVART